MDEGFLAGAGGARIFYRIIGTGPDTLIAVHGGPGAGMNAFFPDVAPIAARHTIIFYDQRGGGRSALPADTSLLEARYHVADLEAVRHRFGLERMTVIAHSFGAIVVATYAESYPERLARLILLDAVGPQREAAAAVAVSPYATADSATLRRFIGVMEILLTGAAADPVASCQEYEAIGREMALARGDTGRWQGSSCDMSAEAVHYYYRYTARIGPASFGQWDFTSSLRDVTAPVLIIYGDRDTVGMAAQRAWAGAWPHARLLQVPGVGKGALADRPDLVVSAIEQFVSGRRAQGTTGSMPQYGGALDL
ncbi:MAG TPA: alpha/beta fold hydrolase [Gemmatimonadales bacterium]